MNRTLVKREIASRTEYLFWCPGCKCTHPFEVPRWTFDGNVEKPTFSPSLRVFYTHPQTKQQVTTCHLFVKAGMIEYCGDSPHALAGKTVPMEPIPSTYHIGGVDP
jgi:hypothetical protein